MLRERCVMRASRRAYADTDHEKSMRMPRRSDSCDVYGDVAKRHHVHLTRVYLSPVLIYQSRHAAALPMPPPAVCQLLDGPYSWTA